MVGCKVAATRPLEDTRSDIEPSKSSHTVAVLFWPSGSQVRSSSVNSNDRSALFNDIVDKEG